MKIQKFKSFSKGALQGYFDLLIPKWGNLVIRGMRLFGKDGRRWVAFPTETVVKDNEKTYFPYLRFEDKTVQNTFSEAVIKAIDEYCAIHVQEESKAQSPDDFDWMV